MTQLNDPYQLDPASGLHNIKRQVTKTHMGPQCRQLIEHLDQAIAVTRELAPVRDQGYLTRPRTGTREPLSEEARWERAIWRQWSQHDATSVPGAWYRIVTYQENLPSSIDAQGWGGIDLVGITHCGLPAIIELKATCVDDPTSASGCSPPAMLVQAVSYAVVVQKNWARFRVALEHHLSSRSGLDIQLPGVLQSVAVVCAAPAAYWDEWIGNTPRAQTVKPEAWSAFADLAAAFAGRGFPASFVSLTENGRDENGLPIDIRADVLDLPLARIQKQPA